MGQRTLTKDEAQEHNQRGKMKEWVLTREAREGAERKSGGNKDFEERQCGVETKGTQSLSTGKRGKDSTIKR